MLLPVTSGQACFAQLSCTIVALLHCTTAFHQVGTFFPLFLFSFSFLFFLYTEVKPYGLSQKVKRWRSRAVCLLFKAFVVEAQNSSWKREMPTPLDATLPNYMQPSQVYFFTHSFINWCWTFQVNRTPDTSCATQEISRKSSKRRKGHLFHRKTAKTAGAISGRNRAFQTPTLLFDSRLWTQISPFQVPLPLSKLSPSPLESKPCSKRVLTAQSCSWTRPKPPGLGSEMRRSSRISDNCENLLRGFKWLTLLIHQARQRGQWMPIAQYQVLHSSVQPERKKGKTKA